MTRTYHDGMPELPEYYLSVTSCDLDERRQRWQREAITGKLDATIESHAFRSDDDPQAGRIVHIDGKGETIGQVYADNVQGILLHGNALLAARHDRITAYSLDLGSSALHATRPSFNDVHSMRHGRNGLILTATGTDSIHELNDTTHDLSWSWWAMEHGYDKDRFGNQTPIRPGQDYRGVLYDTWLHTTHVNSAIELSDETVAASLFHQGMIIGIDRTTGQTRPLLDGLERPHALRESDDVITLANTAAGMACKAVVRGNALNVIDAVSLPTKWLQDCHYHDGIWIAVDGENSRVLFANNVGRIIAIDQFDDRWFLYEAEPSER